MSLITPAETAPSEIALSDTATSPDTNILPAIMDTILNRLTLLFLSGSNGEMAAARHAAAQMLAAYDPRTEDELRVAARMISFSMHSLEALSQAATPDMPMNKILRLRSGAVSLSRESDKCERRLQQLQNARSNNIQPQPAETEPQHAQAEKAIALVEATRPQIRTPAGGNSAPAWSKAHHQQQQAARRRITETLRKNQAAHLAAANAKAAPALPI